MNIQGITEKMESWFKGFLFAYIVKNGTTIEAIKISSHYF